LMNPMLLPSIDFPWVSSSYVNQCRDERAHGRGITIATGHQTGAMPMEAAEGRKCEGGAGNGFGSRVVHDTNLRSVGEQNRCQVGPTILFECPAQIPRSFLRSFSLWARHPAETSAELNVRLGAAEFFPGASRQVRRVRKRRR